MSARASGASGAPDAHRPASDTDVEAKVYELLGSRAEGLTICPSEVARSLAAEETPWRALMPQVRQVAQRLADEGRLEVTRRGVVVDAKSPGGPIRLGRPSSPGKA